MTNKKTPHVHAEWIKAKADGEIVQEQEYGETKWIDMSADDWDFKQSWKYRIKPQAPETRMSYSDMANAYMANGEGDTSWHSGCAKALANAAIARAIADGDVVLPGDRAERDMKVAKAVKDRCVGATALTIDQYKILELVDVIEIIAGLK